MEEKKDISVSPPEAGADEAALVARAINGDKAAFGFLVRRHQDRLLRMVMTMTGDLDAALDIVQDSFIRAHQALSRFEAGRPFYPWLSTIATNLAINALKRSARQLRLDDRMIERSDGKTDPLDSILKKENDRRFWEAVRELPEPYRVVFVLRNMEELDYNEIGRRLGISIGTVDSRLYRARRLLMDKLQDLL